MLVTNEIRLAFLHAMWTETVAPRTFQTYMNAAFEAKETQELLCWMTLQEKVKFGFKLLELTGAPLDEELKLNIPHPVANEWCICLNYLAGTPHDCKGPKYQPDPRD